MYLHTLIDSTLPVYSENNIYISHLGPQFDSYVSVTQNNVADKWIEPIWTLNT